MGKTWILRLYLFTRTSYSGRMASLQPVVLCGYFLYLALLYSIFWTVPPVVSPHVKQTPSAPVPRMLCLWFCFLAVFCQCNRSPSTTPAAFIYCFWPVRSPQPFPITTHSDGCISSNVAYQWHLHPLYKLILTVNLHLFIFGISPLRCLKTQSTCKAFVVEY